MKNKHSLDPYPIPKDKTPMFINEQHMAEIYDFEFKKDGSVPDDDDNIRVYVPLDLNRRLILRRLSRVINHYKEANEKNETAFQADVLKIVSQIEIYDQIWYIRHMPDEGKHSAEGIALIKEFIKMLEEIPDGGAELFPFELIDELRNEYSV
jgi:hypothetical protein